MSLISLCNNVHESIFITFSNIFDPNTWFQNLYLSDKEKNTEDDDRKEISMSVNISYCYILVASNQCGNDWQQ